MLMVFASGRATDYEGIKRIIRKIVETLEQIFHDISLPCIM
jgi:hypothetical protein